MTSEKNKKQTKWWHWLEREHIPVIYCNLRDTPHASRKEFRNFAKTYLRHIFIWEKNKILIYWKQQDLDSFAQFFISQIINKTDFLEKLEEYHYLKAKELIESCKSFHNVNFKNKSNKELLDYLENFERLYSNLALYTYIPVIGTFPIEGIVEPYLKKKLKTIRKEDEYGTYYSLLTHHGNKSWVRKEEEELFELAKKIKHGLLDKSKISLFIEKHTKKYAWLQLGYNFLGKPLSKKYFLKKLEKTLKTEIKKLPEIGEIKNEVDKIIKELNIDEKQILLFNALSKIIWLKEYRDGIYTRSHYELHFLIKEILNRFHIPKDLGSYMTVSEYKELLRGKSLDLKNIRRREELFVWLWDDKEYYFQDEAARKKLNKEIGNLDFDSYNINEVQGSVASPGKVEGIAKIIENESNLNKINEGDILIACMTKPSYLIAMQKAVGFVTNEGGITCHAAIVSREMKKPCVIGTKIATKIFKDGDSIELDANKGIVKKFQIKKMKYILWLEDIDKEDLRTVGGKGANLGELFGKFNVPPAFVVTTKAYNNFVELKELKKDITEKLSKLDVGNYELLEKISKELKKLILDREVFEDLVIEIDNALKKLKGNKFAVRSSATAEDLLTASFAGQQDTYLNVEKKDVVNAVKKCWASLFNPRAIYYRHKKKISHNVAMAVVVQEMVQADFAGVMFTVDPINKKYALIEAASGLGEKVVSGSVTPSSFMLNKKSLEIVEKNIIYRIDENIIKKIAKIGLEIEKHYKKPQDIEFVIDKSNKLYIVQSRPITTLE